MKILTTTYDKSKINNVCIFSVFMQHEQKQVVMKVITKNKEIDSIKPYFADQETFNDFCGFCKDAFIAKSQAEVEKVLAND